VPPQSSALCLVAAGYRPLFPLFPISGHFGHEMKECFLEIDFSKNCVEVSASASSGFSASRCQSFFSYSLVVLSSLTYDQSILPLSPLPPHEDFLVPPVDPTYSSRITARKGATTSFFQCASSRLNFSHDVRPLRKTPFVPRQPKKN